jgi:hypothetical protein
MLCYSLIFGVKKSRAYLMESMASLLVGKLNRNLSLPRHLKAYAI